MLMKREFSRLAINERGSKQCRMDFANPLMLEKYNGGRVRFNIISDNIHNLRRTLATTNGICDYQKKNLKDVMYGQGKLYMLLVKPF